VTIDEQILGFAMDDNDDVNGFVNFPQLDVNY
jgi:hypothetical protein